VWGISVKRRSVFLDDWDNVTGKEIGELVTRGAKTEKEK